MCKGRTIRPLDSELPNPMQLVLLGPAAAATRRRNRIDGYEIVSYYPSQIVVSNRGRRGYWSRMIITISTAALAAAFVLVTIITSSIRGLLVLFFCSFIAGFFTGKRVAARMHF